MSDNIPFEIQTEIIQRIPDTKSLIQFRSVSKAWKSVIDSKKFVAAHTLRHQAHNHHLLIGKRDRSDGHVDYVSIVDDDDTFPHQKVSVFVPDSIEKVSNADSIVLGSSRGLLCFYQRKMRTAVIWNPCIRKTVEIAVPDVDVFSKRYLSTVVGFGVCSLNLGPKLVKITYITDWSKLQDIKASTQVEVFTLSAGGTWRSPLSGNVPHEFIIGIGYSQVVVGGFIYWDVVLGFRADGGFWDRKLILSFDLTSEELTKVNLPDSLALDPVARISLFNLRESLAVLELNYIEMCNVWMMIGHGSTRSFNQLYSINAPRASISLGFRKSGEPIIEVKNDTEDYELAIYEPESESNTKNRITWYLFCASLHGNTVFAWSLRYIGLLKDAS